MFNEIKVKLQINFRTAIDSLLNLFYKAANKVMCLFQDLLKFAINSCLFKIKDRLGLFTTA